MHCDECNKLFKKHKYGYAEKEFCSRKCLDKFLSRKAMEKMTPEELEFFTWVRTLKNA